MKTRPPGDCPLFASQAQARLLGLLFHDPQQWHASKNLRETLQISAGALHDELARLQAAGLVERDDSAREHRFRADMTSPLANAVRDLCEKTVAVPWRIRDALADEPGVQAAGIFGSWARGESTAESDIDLMVIGTADLRSLARRIRPIERDIRREINLITYEPDEVRERSRSVFVKDVAAKPVENLVGDLRHHLQPA